MCLSLFLALENAIYFVLSGFLVRPLNLCFLYHLVTGAILSVIGKAVNGLMGPNGEVLEEMEGDVKEKYSSQPVVDVLPQSVMGPNHDHIERCVFSLDLP